MAHQLATLGLSSTTTIQPAQTWGRKIPVISCPTSPDAGDSPTPTITSETGTNAKLTLQCEPVFVKKADMYNKESPHVEEKGSALESQKNKPQTKLNRIISKVTTVAVWTPKSKSPLGQTHWNLPHDNKHQQQLYQASYTPSASAGAVSTKVGTVTPQRTQSLQNLHHVCFAGCFDSSNGDSPHNHRWVLGNQSTVISVFWKQHQYRKNISQFVRMYLIRNYRALLRIPLQI